MADVVRSGAIFRVRSAKTLKSPLPRLPGMRRRPSSVEKSSTNGETSQKRVAIKVRQNALETMAGGIASARKRKKKKKQKHVKQEASTQRSVEEDADDNDRNHLEVEKQIGKNRSPEVIVVTSKHSVRKSPISQYPRQHNTKNTNTMFHQQQEKQTKDPSPSSTRLRASDTRTAVSGKRKVGDKIVNKAQKVVEKDVSITEAAKKLKKKRKREQMEYPKHEKRTKRTDLTDSVRMGETHEENREIETSLPPRDVETKKKTIAVTHSEDEEGDTDDQQEGVMIRKRLFPTPPSKEKKKDGSATLNETQQKENRPPRISSNSNRSSSRTHSKISLIPKGMSVLEAIAAPPKRGVDCERTAKQELKKKVKKSKTMKLKEKDRETIKEKDSMAVSDDDWETVEARRLKKVREKDLKRTTHRVVDVVKEKSSLRQRKEKERKLQKMEEKETKVSAIVMETKVHEAIPKHPKVATDYEQKSEQLDTSFTSVTSQSQRRPRSKVLKLCDWYFEWPPWYDQSSDDNGSASKLQLALAGQISGRHARFLLGKRMGQDQFISPNYENIRLVGCLNIEKATEQGVPSSVMELMVDGLPCQWRSKLKAYASDTVSPKRVSKPSGIIKRRREDVESTDDSEWEPDEEPTKRSRSGPNLNPAMGWRREEQPRPDTSFVDGTASQLTKLAANQTKTTKISRQGSTSSPVAKLHGKVKRNKNEAELSDATSWSEAQLQTLADAKVKVPPTTSNYWAVVAQFIPGKTAADCRAKSFESFTSPTGRKSHKLSTNTSDTMVIPQKIHRAGSNRFKKQVREFVQKLEQKNADDIFSTSTPSKAELEGTQGLDDIKSPAVAGGSDLHSVDDEDDYYDDYGLPSAGRELLEKVTLAKRDEVDSYVLALKRSRANGCSSVSYSSKALQTPKTAKQNKKPTKHAVRLVEEVGSHYLEGIVSPGGTTKVRIEKDGSSSEEEDFDSDEEGSSSDFH